MFSLSMFGPFRCSFFGCSVPFEVRSFDIQSFDFWSYSTFSLSMFGPIRGSVFRCSVLFDVRSFEVRSFDVQFFEVRSFKVWSFEVRSRFPFTPPSGFNVSGPNYARAVLEPWFRPGKGADDRADIHWMPARSCCHTQASTARLQVPDDFLVEVAGHVGHVCPCHWKV